MAEASLIHSLYWKPKLPCNQTSYSCSKNISPFWEGGGTGELISLLPTFWANFSLLPTFWANFPLLPKRLPHFFSLLPTFFPYVSLLPTFFGAISPSSPFCSSPLFWARRSLLAECYPILNTKWSKTEIKITEFCKMRTCFVSLFCFKYQLVWQLILGGNCGGLV